MDQCRTHFMVFAIVILAGFSEVFTSGAIAQTATSETQKPASENAPGTLEPQPTVNEEEPEPFKLSAKETAELYELLLGPWTFLTKASNGLPNNETVKKAIARCFVPAKVKQLNIEPGTVRKLPDAKNLRGDLIYYKTSKGLQRFELKRGRINILSRMQRLERTPGRIIWALLGRSSGYSIRFATIKNRGGRAQLMLENSNMYLRCRFNRDKPAPTEN